MRRPRAPGKPFFWGPIFPVTNHNSQFCFLMIIVKCNSTQNNPFKLQFCMLILKIINILNFREINNFFN